MSAEAKQDLQPQAVVLTRPPRLLLTFSLVLTLMSAVVVGALTFVPWRQTVIGQGRVAVFSPLDRPQDVESQIKGRIVELLVQEGDIVEEGQVVVRLEDRDSKFLDPRQGERLEGQRRALRGKREAGLERVAALQSQVGAIASARNAYRNAAQAKVAQTEQKLRVQRQLLRVAEQDLLTAQLQQKRIETLNKEGLKSDRAMELTRQKYVQAEAKLAKLKGEFVLLERDIELAGLELPKIEAEASEKTQKALESLAKARETIAEVDEKLEKLANDAGTLKVRRSLQDVVAPRSGRIVNMKKFGIGELLKEGDVLAHITPVDHQDGVELFLSGLDTPLVETGRPVRLMFEGFPAVPFVGWPWASVGTFGGIVTSVDPVLTEVKGQNGFRVWVMPDPEQPDWPKSDRLRLGARATGWIMLNEVPLYYELWRQLNAFPAQPASDQGGKMKLPKTKPVIRR